MIERQLLEALFAKHGFEDYKWIKSDQIKVAQWVRFKCLFGCAMYGKKGTCPPNTPPIDQCREFFLEYEKAVIFHLEKTLEKPEDYRPWSNEAKQRLLELEREVFLAGHHKAFLVSFEACSQCVDCVANRLECANKKGARPGADALGIDVYATARGVGYPIQVLKNFRETMNRYAFLLIE
jgi:predicted metal-binding protein